MRRLGLNGKYTMTAKGSKEGKERPTGMFDFTLVWLGQLVSVLASAMSSFALTIWAYQRTGSATVLGLVNTAFVIPFLALSPFAGVMVDRYNRKLMMMVSDLAAIVGTGGIFILNLTGHLQIWHLYVAAALAGLGNTFQWPAYSAAISTMVPKKQYTRANGMMSLIDSGPGVFAPLLAGALMPFIGLNGILTIDVVTFFFAIGVLLLVHIPQPTRSADGEAGKGNLIQEALFGFKYIFARKGLLGLLTFFLSVNFVSGLAFGVFTPYILASTANNSQTLGAVLSATAIGAVVGGLLVSLWGGFKRRIKSIFLGETMIAVVGLFLFGLGHSAWYWIIIGALGAIWNPLSNGASQAIWQAKVPPDVQGRVFSARRLIAWSTGPITPVLAGLLADYVTGPAMQPKGALSGVFGWLVGTGPGAGMALQFAIGGVLYLLIVMVVLFFVPVVRNLEDSIPDHDKVAVVEAEEA
jgi:DHA3 family macrolide efflux protein-like MFS transporter